MSRIDYEHDSLQEILLKQRERICALEEAMVRQADRIAQLEIEKIEWEEGAEPQIVREHVRMTQAMCALEDLLARRVGSGERLMPIMSTLAALGDIANYATSGVATRWLAEAMDREQER